MFRTCTSVTASRGTFPLGMACSDNGVRENGTSVTFCQSSDYLHVGFASSVAARKVSPTGPHRTCSTTPGTRCTSAKALHGQQRECRRVVAAAFVLASWWTASACETRSIGSTADLKKLDTVTFSPPHQGFEQRYTVPRTGDGRLSTSLARAMCARVCASDRSTSPVRMAVFSRWGLSDS